MEIVTNESMPLFTTNVSYTAIDIQKSMKVAVSTYMPGQVVKLGNIWISITFVK